MTELLSHIPKGKNAGKSFINLNREEEENRVYPPGSLQGENSVFSRRFSGTES
ncbi:MAG: hypothetical protein R2744_08785 [Bacteroidales bacterium]